MSPEPTDGSSGADHEGHEDPAAQPGEGEGEEHRADGLELARRIARATAGAGGSPARRRKPRRAGGDPAGNKGSGSHPDDRDPQTLDATLGRLVADHGWELDLRVHGVFGRWVEMVGGEVAGHCTPESFADGRLVVRTDSTAWATQLRLLAPSLVRRLNEELGHGTVTVIEVLGPHLPTWRKGPRSVRDGRGPRDTYG